MEINVNIFYCISNQFVAQSIALTTFAFQIFLSDIKDILTLNQQSSNSATISCLGATALPFSHWILC